MANKTTHKKLEPEVNEFKAESLQNEQAKAALKESEERYRRITEAVTDYVFNVRIVDGHPADTVHGPGCVAVTGYTPEDFDSDPYLWIRMVPKEDQELVQEQARCVLLGQDIKAIEHRILRKDGVIRWVKNTLVPQYGRQGQLLSYDGIVRDIDKRKQAEAALKKAHEELEHRVDKRTADLKKANAKLQYEIEERKRLEKILMQKEKLKTLGAIIAEVAHEIRNPLVSIGGFALRLKKKLPDIPECDIILSESKRLENILSRIKWYIEPVEIHPQECSINTIITEWLSHLSANMGKKDVSFALELCQNLPAAYVDPDILHQIFTELIRNTTNILKKGGDLRVRTFESDQGLHIEFMNQGPGLKIEHPDTLFMPFAEGEQSFGLPFCYRLLKDMDGFISFVQEKDSFCLTVSLPKSAEPAIGKSVPGPLESNHFRERSVYV